MLETIMADWVKLAGDVEAPGPVDKDKTTFNASSLKVNKIERD
jgi:hypothetical protein